MKIAIRSRPLRHEVGLTTVCRLLEKILKLRVASGIAVSRLAVVRGSLGGR